MAFDDSEWYEIRQNPSENVLGLLLGGSKGTYS